MSQILKIENNLLEIAVSTYGAELVYVNSKNGTNFLWDGDKNVWSGRAPVLFPICSSFKDNKYIYNNKEYTLPKHGFGRLSEFEGEKVSENELVFTLKSNETTRQNYPFDFELNITYKLIANTLCVTYCVKNMTDGEMYFSIGAHEAYSCPEGIQHYYVEFEDEVTLDNYIYKDGVLTNEFVTVAKDTKIFPLNYKYFNNECLIFKNIKFHKASLVNKETGKRIDVEFGDSNYFLLWTLPKAKYICLEPWNGICDIEGTDHDITKKEGIIKLLQDKHYTSTHTITFND